MDVDDGPDNNQASKAVTRLWRAWRTIHEMVQDRGYELAEDEVRISLERFRSEYVGPSGVIDYNKLQFSARPSDAMNKKFTPPPTAKDPNPTPQTGTLFVQFCPEQGSIGVNVVKSFVMLCVTNKHKTGIFVTATALSPQARKAISAAMSHASIEAFLEEDLLVNITHHELVPIHILLSKEEKTALLRRYRLKETQLPRILQRDPVARYMGLKRGQVVKIIRDSETAGRYASYRLCV